MNHRVSHIVLSVLHWVVLVLSALLIVFISIDTFQGVDFLHNTLYMQFQLWVCVVFMADFFIELALTDNRRKYMHDRWLYLLLSIPYLNLVHHFNIPLTSQELYWVRFIPLARATMAMAIVVGYVSKNKISSLFASYILILVAFIYFASLIFFNAEHGVNPQIPNYLSSLWWACMDATTIGCQIQPVTVTGKILSAVLSCMGVMIFPLFTVYMTSVVQRYNSRRVKSLTDIFGNKD